MIAAIVIFIASSLLLLILLMAVLYHYKHGRQTKQEPTYEHTFPPQLPPRRLTTSENPAYGKIIINKHAASGLNPDQLP